jgi:hypothetical protein
MQLRAPGNDRAGKSPRRVIAAPLATIAPGHRRAGFKPGAH